MEKVELNKTFCRSIKADLMTAKYFSTFFLPRADIQGGHL